MDGAPSASDEYAPVLELLSLARELPDACRHSLAAMAPHCLAVPKDERDPYQQSMVDAIASVAMDVEAQHRAAIDEARAGIADAEREWGVAAAAVADAAQKVATRSAECDAKRQARDVAKTGILAATEAAQRKRARLVSLRTQRTATAADRTKLQKLISDTLPPLRMGTMVGLHGSRADHKLTQMVDSVVTVLEQQGVQKSFMDAAAAMFRLKPDDRGPFAQRVLMGTEEALAKHLLTLEARLGDLGREFAEAEATQVEAENAVISAPKRHGACVEEYLAVEIELMEAETALHKAEDAEKAMQHGVAQRVPAMECANQRLAVVRSHIKKLEALRQRERCVASQSTGSGNAKVFSERRLAQVQALAPSAGA